jgi:hypothetical protein
MMTKALSDGAQRMREYALDAAPLVPHAAADVDPVNVSLVHRHGEVIEPVGAR